MRRFLTRYTLSFPRSLVYMLQSCEYDVRAFFRWYERVEDFRYVEKRKSIEWTRKAVALWRGSWVFIAFILIVIILCVFSGNSLLRALAAVLAVVAPLSLPSVLAAATQVGQLIQKPIERRAINEARKKLRGHSGLKIAIAGSYGKTTTREIVKAVLSSGKKVAAPPGSYNTPLGIASFIQSLEGDEEVIIFELGEFRPGDVQALCDMVRPHIGVITGVNEAHLEEFGSLDRTADTIFELARYLGERPLYVNAENETARARAPEGSILYSRKGVGDWRIEDAGSSLSGTSFTITGSGINVRASSKLLGLHMVGPIAAAAHLAWSLSLTVAQIEAGIAQTKPFAHRLELAIDQSGVATLDDSYNGNPDGVRAVIAFLATLRRRRFYVTPGLVEMGDRTEAVHHEIGMLLARSKIEYVMLVRNSVAPFIEAGLKAGKYSGDLTFYDDALGALAALPYLTAGGDVVLLQNDWPDQYA